MAKQSHHRIQLDYARRRVLRAVCGGAGIAAFAVGTAFCNGAAAQVVKCTGADGQVTYQDQGCQRGTAQLIAVAARPAQIEAPVESGAVASGSPPPAAATPAPATPIPADWGNGGDGTAQAQTRLALLEHDCIAGGSGRRPYDACRDYRQTVMRCVDPANPGARTAPLCVEYFQREQRIQDELKNGVKRAEEKQIARALATCTLGLKSACVEAACRRAGRDEASDADVLTCARMSGLAAGTRWAASDRWQQTPGRPGSEWWINVRCLGDAAYTGRGRPTVTLWRRNEVSERTFDLAAAAERECREKVLHLARR